MQKEKGRKRAVKSEIWKVEQVSRKNSKQKSTHLSFQTLKHRENEWKSSFSVYSNINEAVGLNKYDSQVAFHLLSVISNVSEVISRKYSRFHVLFAVFQRSLQTTRNCLPFCLLSSVEVVSDERNERQLSEMSVGFRMSEIVNYKWRTFWSWSTKQQTKWV